MSVVAPVYNEEASLTRFHAELIAALRGLGVSYEIIYVDDGSEDRSPAALRTLRASDATVRLLQLSRNFGHQAAITAGMDHARGEACVIIDADGQDPPDVLPRLFSQWRSGAQVVYAVRTRREGEGWFKRISAALFYRLMRLITRVDIPVDAGDFRLLDRKVLDVMKTMRERHRFMRGLTSWVGFKQSRVEYARKPRLGGRTHYPFWKMLLFAVDGITSFSLEPLRWVTYCGLFSFVLSVAAGLWAVYVKLYNARAVQGWTSLMIVLLFLGGLQLVSLGVIGEYLGRIFDEVKMRPLYVVRQAEGFES